MGGPEFVLRDAGRGDLDWIVQLETRPDFAAFIHRWPRDAHDRNLSDPDMRYLVWVDAAAHPAAYVILAGLASPARSIELVRMAVAAPGAGLGSRLLRHVIRLAFEQLGANRLWLDLFDDNHRARHVYKNAGFQQEGVLRDAALRADGTIGSLVVMSILRREYAT